MLTWTTEPPTVPGWYWVKYSDSDTCILKACRYTSHWAGDKYPEIRLAWEIDRFTHLSGSDITTAAKFFSGPIPEPVDNDTAMDAGE